MGLNDIVFDRSHHEYLTPSIVGDTSRAVIPARSVARAVWTCDDTRKSILFSLVPGSILLTSFGYFYKNKEICDFFKKCKLPKWAPKDPRVYASLDMLTMAPLGYATYLVYRNGGVQYCDTRAALAICGVNAALKLTSIPMTKMKDMRLFAWNTSLTALTAVATAYAFYKIDKTAGMLFLPYALCSGFYTVLTYVTCAKSECSKSKSDSN
uniref:Mitochondrial pyruvate carrier n=1 Tax=Syphacia muris TaxID=451379 RepID=A0A0N5ALD5_9BILA